MTNGKQKNRLTGQNPLTCGLSASTHSLANCRFSRLVRCAVQRTQTVAAQQIPASALSALPVRHAPVLSALLRL
jgi:hypothetical protein